VFSLFSRPPELVLTLCLLLVLVRLGSSATRADRVLTLCVLSVIGFLMHACLVKLEWFYRYEAALMALGILALGWVLSRAANRAILLKPLLASAAGTVFVVLLALPLASRALSAVVATPRAMRNVFDQQYQMATFFRGAYAGDAIAVNDIGAIAWLSTSRILDVYGLATQEVADLKRQRQWDRDRLQAVAAREQVKAVAMYERVLAPLIPTTWTLVGEWRIAGNVAVSEDTVGFYAPTPGDVSRLRTALDAYAPRLPRSVTYIAR
jgi:hypothetical protein